MKYVKICGISLLAALLIALILALKFCGGEEPTEKEEFLGRISNQATRSGWGLTPSPWSGRMTWCAFRWFSCYIE